MNRDAVIIWGVILLGAIGLGAYKLKMFLDFSADYREAEPLVEQVWPLAEASKKFYVEHQRRPVSLDEAVAFDNALAVDLIRPYPHQFFAEGPEVFRVDINDMHSLVIDGDFRPNWGKPE
ncbi:hypothetical protein [Cerasicoccus fimbriatus]|uniref:hypothetical protein n=1 Tax=Cerasicoccus fimbriatus TaxID=3014554 RepID=UPI0022B43214|nr:hypothetical protein [Cerasicoccus sp. TK19100]